MSDFTYANLILAKNTEIAKAHLEKGAYLLDYDRWACVLNPNNTQAVALSDKIPVLYYAHAEDHGMEFAILQHGKTVSSFCVYWEQKTTDKLFSNINAENFGLFDFSQAEISQIKALLSPQNAADSEDIFSMVQELILMLGLEELEFVAWDYVTGNEEHYAVIAKG